MFKFKKNVTDCFCKEKARKGDQVEFLDVKSLKSLPPCYSQPPLINEFAPPPPPPPAEVV
jgi:hypothetical protein